LLITALFCLTAASNTARAANYYLDVVNGDDSNPGTETQPWKTLAKACNTAQATDTVLVRAGIYNESLRPVNSGTSGSMITFKAYPGDNVVIDGQGAQIPGVDFSYGGGRQYIRVEAFEIRNWQPGAGSGGILFSGSGVEGIEMVNCDIHDNGIEGIALWAAKDSLIEGNHIHNNGGNGIAGGLGAPATNITIRGNRIHDNYDDGMKFVLEQSTIENNILGPGGYNTPAHSDGISIEHMTNSTIRNNIIHDYTQLIYVSMYESVGVVENLDIYGNIFYNNEYHLNSVPSGGTSPAIFFMPGIASSGPHYVKNISIHSNTFLWLGLPAIWIGEKGIPVTNINIRNNIFFDSDIYILTDPAEISSDYNLFFDSPDPGTATPWINEGSHSIIGQDPLLADYERFVSWDVHLKSTSPAIDAGDPALASVCNLPTPFLDIDNNNRPQDGDGNSIVVFDMGAYEYVSGSPDTTPPLPPTNLISTARTENSISLSWTAPGPSSDGDLASRYRIYRDGPLVDTVTNTSFQDTGLAADTSYSYEVYSVDDAGNQSTSAATGTFSTSSADTTPPVISNIQASGITTNEATITWSTNETSTSQVEYGPDTNYGNSTTLDTNLVISHSVSLIGLASETLYHYRVRSKDASGNESISQDDTVTTTGVKCSLTVSSTIGGSVTTPGEPGPYQYDQGTEVSIEATEDLNYRFVNWTGTAVNAGKVANPDSASTTVTMDADYTIQANFVIDETDKTAPTVTNLSPQQDSIQVPLNTLLILDIADSGDGVDASSVTIKVNDNTVYSGNTAKYSSAYGECYRTGTKADYTFIYQSNETFSFDQPISVMVNATDLAGNAMVEYSYSFTTEMRSFGENKKVGSDNLNKSSAVTVRDGKGDIWATWQAGATGSRDIYIGKLTAGAANFNNSIKVKDNSTDQCNPAMAVGSDDKLYVAWQDNRRGNWDIYVSTSSDGINWSTETRVTDSNDNQIDPAIVVDSSNNAYIVWEDDRNGNQDIYVATSSSGFVTKTVSQITLDSSDQVEPAIAVDSDNTVYIVWTDTRNSKNDIYGAASNNGPWTNLPVVTTEQSQSSPAIAIEAVGSILHLVWVDDTPGDDDIFYAKTSGGLPGSPLTGSSIIDGTSSTDQLRPVIAVSGNTGNKLQVFACWEDERNADDDLYFAELGSGSGTNVFVNDDGTNSDQTEPAISIDGDGHPYLVWTDSRNTNTDIYYAGSTFIEPDVLASNNISTSSTVTVGIPLNAIDSLDDVSVVVPVGAYPCDIKITISKITNPLAFAMQCLGAYDFGPSNIEFSQPVTVTIPYNFTGPEDSALAYWYNSLTDALSQQGITDVETIKVSPSLHALRFKTTHFTPFYIFLVSGAAGAAASGGGGGGCSMSPDSQASVVELILPYIGLTVAMVVLKMRDRRKRKALNITKSEC
jgi:hypothetical protein